jgi:hypothetical protein
MVLCVINVRFSDPPPGCLWRGRDWQQCVVKALLAALCWVEMMRSLFGTGASTTCFGIGGDFVGKKESIIEEVMRCQSGVGMSGTGDHHGRHRHSRHGQGHAQMN